MDWHKSDVFRKTFNLLLLTCSVWLLIVIAMMLFRRQSHLERSGWIFGPEAPLMDSALLDLVVTPISAIVVLVLAACAVAKEFVIRTGRNRILINSALLVITAGFMGFLSQALML